MGNGRLDDLRDVVVVDYHRFERERSQDVALDVARFNRRLLSEGRPYVLVGVGRWGSSEPFLGIPVSWDQIAGVRAIVEAGLPRLHRDPVAGHPLLPEPHLVEHRLLHGEPGRGRRHGGLGLAGAQPAVDEASCVRHLRFDAPIVVKMNGRTNEGVILKPAP